MFITCLDTALIPETWDLKIKHEFFRLKFEVEGVSHHAAIDVSMSEAPGDGGDDDPQKQNQDKGVEPDRNAKRTKNTGEDEGDKGENGGSTSPPNNTVHNLGVVTNTVRYDTVFNFSNELCLNPKKLLTFFSDVADMRGECMLNSTPLERRGKRGCGDVDHGDVDHACGPQSKTCRGGPGAAACWAAWAGSGGPCPCFYPSLWCAAAWWAAW
jgi:hypothetical protein